MTDTQHSLSALPEWAADAARELVSIVGAIPARDVDALCTMISEAHILAVHGLGREGLMMRALAMRLFHLGLHATPVGDVALPAVGPGDILLVSAGPGNFDTVAALMRIARQAGARTILLTAEGGASLKKLADLTVLLPARTMARPVEASSDVVAPALPMGSAYEGALFLFSEYVVARLATTLTVDEGAMRARHTNLE
jgi:6-phospho-3-hexuloisomerase